MKIINDGRYVFTISLDILYFMKNNIDKVSKRKIPSERTIVQTDAKTNESNMALLPYLKKITSDEILDKDQPDYVLLLAWHLSEAIINKWKNRGLKSKFIIPLPEVKIV